jgi:Zn finger protein HypA/HybF involved in hydrogenase expression
MKTIDLTLKCPKCSHEWTERLDAEEVHLRPLCPECTEQPVYIVNITV